MADVVNPGLVNVADEVLENPDPNGGSVLLVPENTDALTDAADQGYPPAGNDVDASPFPTPTEVTVTQVPTGQVVLSSPVPNAAEVNVDDQVIGQGVWVYIDPLNPAAGKKFVPPGEFLVVGPDASIQTNYSEETTVTCTVTGVYDADNLWNAPGVATTRFLLVVGPPTLTSYPISILGRNIVFADDTLTTADAGAVRVIGGYNTNYLTISKEDLSDSNVPELAIPQIGDTFTLDVQRQGAEDIRRTGAPTADVTIFPPPPTFVPNPNQDLASQGNVNVSTGPQPGLPIINSGVGAPTASNVFVADQSTTVGLPIINSGVGAPTASNVFVADQSTTVGLPVNVNVS